MRDVDDVFTFGDDELQDALTQQRACGAHGDRSEAGDLAGMAARLPRRLDDAVTRMEEGGLAVQTPRVEQRLRSLERTGRRIVSAVMFAALFLGALLLREDAPVWSVILLVASLPAALHAVFANWASGRGPR